MSVILATAGYDHKIRFWEAPSGICSRVLKYPDSQVNKLEITPDKQFLAAGGNPHIRIYEIADGSTPTNVVVGGGSGSGGGGGGGGSPGGGTSSAAEQQQHQQQPVLTLEGHTSSVTSLGFQRDGRYLYSGSEDGTIKLWDLRNPTYSRSFDAKAPVRSVTLRVDRDEIISGDADGMIKIWDLSGSGNTTTPTSNNIAGSTHPTPSSSNINNNENIAGGGNNNNNNNNPASASTAAAAAANINRGGTTTATKNSSTSSNKKSKGLIHSLQPADGYTGGCLLQTSIQAVDISEDSRTLIAVSNHGTVYVWDPSTLDSISNSSLSSSSSTAIKGLSSTSITEGGPEGLLPIIGNNNSNQSHQSQPALITKFRSHPQPGSYCLHARISPDCRTLCTTGSDGSAKLWDTTTWKLSQNLHQHSKWVWDAAFCADSSYLVTASSDTTARLWNLRSGEVVRQYHGHQSAVTCVALNDSSV